MRSPVLAWRETRITSIGYEISSFNDNRKLHNFLTNRAGLSFAIGSPCGVRGWAQGAERPEGDNLSRSESVIVSINRPQY